MIWRCQAAFAADARQTDNSLRREFSQVVMLCMPTCNDLMHICFGWSTAYKAPHSLADAQAAACIEATGRCCDALSRANMRANTYARQHLDRCACCSALSRLHSCAVAVHCSSAASHDGAARAQPSASRESGAPVRLLSTLAYNIALRTSSSDRKYRHSDRRPAPADAALLDVLHGEAGHRPSCSRLYDAPGGKHGAEQRRRPDRHRVVRPAGPRV